QGLAARLAQLDARRQAAFAGLCAERLMPFYRWFQRTERWGDYDGLRRSLDVVWDYVGGVEITASQAENLRKLVDAATPDTDEFSDALASRAMDAATAVSQTVAICAEPSNIRAAEVGEIAFEAAFGVEQSGQIQNVDQPRIADRVQ